MKNEAPSPLAGYTVAVTAARRAEELGALLERRGARVVYAPAIQIVPLEDDTELQQATKLCLHTPPDITIATTGIGFRGWLEAADGWGLGDDLRERLGGSRLIARGPKARGAIRAAGLTEEWSPPSESMSEVLDHLLEEDLSDVRVGVQLHGEPLPDFVDALEAAGAQVVTVPVYRWQPPPDSAPLERLVEQIVAGEIDAATFTSAPAVVSLLQCADQMGVAADLADALRHRTLAFCVGPVTAAPLERRAIATVQPDRPRLGNLVRAVVEALPARRGRPLNVHGHVIDVRSHAVVVDGRVVCPPPAPMAVLAALAAAPGRVLTRQDLLAALPGGGSDEHAVEMAVTRLRAAIGDPAIVQTIVKRGYRLAYDPEKSSGIASERAVQRE